MNRRIAICRIIFIFILFISISLFGWSLGEAGYIAYQLYILKTFMGSAPNWVYFIPSGILLFVSLNLFLGTFIFAKINWKYIKKQAKKS